MMKKSKSKRPTARPKIQESEALRNFISLHPAFEKCWKEAPDFYGEVAVHMVYGDFARKIVDILIDNPQANLAHVLDYVETLLREGTDDVRGFVSVYFIDGLLANGDDYPKILAPIFRLFGPLSREYALKWNRFLGTKNFGLEE